MYTSLDAALSTGPTSCEIRTVNHRVLFFNPQGKLRPGGVKLHELRFVAQDHTTCLLQQTSLASNRRPKEELLLRFVLALAHANTVREKGYRDIANRKKQKTSYTRRFAVPVARLVAKQHCVQNDAE